MTQNGSGCERLKTTEFGKDIFGNIFSVGGIFAPSANCALGNTLSYRLISLVSKNEVLRVIFSAVG